MVPIAVIGDVYVRWSAPELEQEVNRAVGRGLKAAAIFLAARVREILSVPAPRKRVISHSGNVYYRATTPATPGAPPRKLSGQLRRSITWEISNDGKVARVGSNVIYARRHELGTHPFLVPTLVANAGRIASIIGRESAGGMQVLTS